jgi:hypothetical protein
MSGLELLPSPDPLFIGGAAGTCECGACNFLPVFGCGLNAFEVPACCPGNWDCGATPP